MSATPTPFIRNAKIVGNHYRDDEAKAVFKALTDGQDLAVELEPTNPYDPFAVKVRTNGVFIGYVPKEISGVFYVLPAEKLVLIAHKGGTFSAGLLP